MNAATVTSHGEVKYRSDRPVGGRTCSRPGPAAITPPGLGVRVAGLIMMMNGSGWPTRRGSPGRVRPCILVPALGGGGPLKSSVAEW